MLIKQPEESHAENEFCLRFEKNTTDNTLNMLIISSKLKFPTVK